MSGAIDTPTRAESGVEVADVSVVVVSHNNRHEIDDCLRNVLELGCPVVVVDTASGDGTADRVRSHHAAVELVELAENTGFGTAANTGFALVETQYVLLLNADTIATPGAVAELVAAAGRAPSAAAIGPRLVYPDGTRQRSIFGYPRGPVSLFALVAIPYLATRLYVLRQRLGRTVSRTAGNDIDVVPGSEFVSGAALLIRKEPFTAVGGFDSRFFMYCEEIDLCRRLRDSGWLVGYHPGATFVHVGGASTRDVQARMYGELVFSYLVFLAKHRGPRVAARARALVVTALAVRALLPGTRRERAQAALRRLRDRGSWSPLATSGGSQ